MQSSNLTTCSMSMFGDDIRHFFTDSLDGLLEKYPLMEFPHKQDFYMLLYIESAEGEVEIDHHKIRLDKAKVIIVQPRCIVSIHINRQALGRMICFTESFFSLRYNNNILYQFSFLQRESQPYIRLNEHQKQQWDLLLGLLEAEFNYHRKDSSKVLRSYLNILLYELERINNPTGFTRIKSLKSEKVQHFEELIEKWFVTKKLPSDYAALLCVSPNYLNKICKEETGQTAGDLIRKRITIEAQRMLHYTHWNVSEIANKLGFESASYFVTYFKKNTGFTPERFRKEQE